MLDTFSGERTFQMATKEYVDKRVFNEIEINKIFTNNSGTDLWQGWNLEVRLSGMTIYWIFQII